MISNPNLSFIYSLLTLHISNHSYFCHPVPRFTIINLENPPLFSKTAPLKLCSTFPPLTGAKAPDLRVGRRDNKRRAYAEHKRRAGAQWPIQSGNAPPWTELKVCVLRQRAVIHSRLHLALRNIPRVLFRYCVAAGQEWLCSSAGWKYCESPRERNCSASYRNFLNQCVRLIDFLLPRNATGLFTLPRRRS